MTGGQGVVGSNPAIPTKSPLRHCRTFAVFDESRFSCGNRLFLFPCCCGTALSKRPTSERRDSKFTRPTTPSSDDQNFAASPMFRRQKSKCFSDKFSASRAAKSKPYARKYRKSARIPRCVVTNPIAPPPALNVK